MSDYQCSHLMTDNMQQLILLEAR